MTPPDLRPRTADTQSRAPVSRTRNGDRLAVLEAYRAGAAGLVLLSHVGYFSGAGLHGPWAGWLARGDAGVAVFFVLSGFVLMRQWVLPGRDTGSPPRTGPYLWRRAVRLLPAYLAAMAGVLVLVPSARTRPVADWARASTLTTIYDRRPLLPGFAQTWSLATEVSFYLVLPWLAKLWLGRGTRHSRRMARETDGRRVAVVVAVLVVAATVWRLTWSISQADDLVPLNWLPAYLDWFAAGMLLAWLRERRADGGPRLLRDAAAAPGAWFATAAAIYWLATTPLAGPYDLAIASAGQMLLKHLLYLGFAICLLMPAVFGDPAARWQVAAASPAVQWAGTISYGFFLWHLIVLTAVFVHLHLVLFDAPFLPLLGGVLVPSTIAAALSWYLLERPVQRRLRRWLG
jgi:peptidoglycan/LPS O-acetylase OafA/YrhL